MRIQLWSKLLKKKPITGVILGLVLVSAMVTVYRLASNSSSQLTSGPRSEHGTGSFSNTGRSTSPVELSWPLPFSHEEESSGKPLVTNRRKVHVDEDQLKKLKKIYPMCVCIQSKNY